jgi:outer membrane protein
MSRLRQAAFAAVSCGALGLAGAAGAETLGDAIRLAYQTNPVLQAARATQRATDEEYPQAMAGLRPTLQEVTTVTHSESQLGSIFAPGVQNLSNHALQLSIPVYTGGRVATAVDAATADVLAGRQTLRLTENQLLFAVVQAYVDVRRDQEQLAISLDNVNVLKRQLEETNARFDVGEVTRTDTSQAQARLAQAQAQLASVQSTLAISRATYDQVVGQNPGDLAPEPPVSKLLPTSIEQAFDVAEASNPQLLEANYAEQAAAARVAEAKAQTRPNVAVQGSFGYEGGLNRFGLSTGNPFSNYARQISAQATLTIPLFTGGLTSSQVRQAAERDNVQRIGIETARRQVLQQVSQAWNQLLGARASLVANEEQVRANTVAYEGVRQEEQVGLRTTLDVLNAQQELENAELALVGARHDEYLAAAAVLEATGSLEARGLTPDVPIYDPAKNFHSVRHAIGWTPWEPVVEVLDHLGAPAPTPNPPPTPPGQVVKP